MFTLPDSMRTNDWFDGICDPVPLQTSTPFEVFAVRVGSTAKTLLLANESLAAADAQRRSDALATAHEQLAGPHIPALQSRGSHRGRPWLLLDAALVSNGDELLCVQADRSIKQPYAAAMGGLSAVVSMVRRIHEVIDPHTRAPYAMGTIGAANLYYDQGGGLWVLGAGDNGFARARTLLPTMLAPELALGESPTPATDIFALSALIRSMVPYVDVPEPIARVLRGDETDSWLARLTHETNARIWGVPKARRPPLALLERVFRGLLRVLGVSPSYEAHCAFIEKLLIQDEVASQPSSPRVVLELAADASWFRVQQQDTQRLGSRAPLRRVLLCLVDHAERGESCDVWRLLEAGWPGERVDPEAGANRVYAAVSTLRRMGLRSVIERFDAGYRIGPSVQIERR